MKKRITSLVLAVLMVISVVSTSAAAVEEEDGIEPYVIDPIGNACPKCMNGVIIEVLTGTTVGTSTETRFKCSCGDGRFMCKRTTTRYRDTYTRKCNRCGNIFSTRDSAWYTRTVDDHDACWGCKHRLLKV